MTRVLIIESEKGWGQKVDEIKEFPTRKEAETFCMEYNSKYNPIGIPTPDWYMFAKIEGAIGLGMLRLPEKGKS